MEQELTKSEAGGERATASERTEQSLEDHPLFMTRIPSATDFKNNAMLAALAALIDEEEEPEEPGPVRRQRHSVRCEPWRVNRSSLHKVRNSAFLTSNHHEGPRSQPLRQVVGSRTESAQSSRVGDHAACINRRSEAAKTPTASSSNGMECEGELPEEASFAPEEQRTKRSGTVVLASRAFLTGKLQSGFRMKGLKPSKQNSSLATVADGGTESFVVSSTPRAGGGGRPPFASLEGDRRHTALRQEKADSLLPADDVAAPTKSIGAHNTRVAVQFLKA
ncbi:hypothetical protein Efla_005167 [Eimeria flavescens]